jgi:hypothetical protein
MGGGAVSGLGAPTGSASEWKEPASAFRRHPFSGDPSFPPSALRRPGLRRRWEEQTLVNLAPRCLLGILVLASIVLLAGCRGREDSDLTDLSPTPGTEAPTTGSQPAGDLNASGGVNKSEEERKAILSGIMQLIRTAPDNPGGQNFTIATEHLNQYFEGVDAKAFAMNEPERAYLLPRVKEKGIADLESPQFQIRDARHIEDCILYNSIATRVGGDGDDLTRVRRVFDWMVQQIQLVPAGSLAPRRAPQAKARPYDVLLRGMATEEQDWAERSWLFMALCRQLGVDVGLLYYPSKLPAFMLPQDESGGTRGDIPWICGALIEGKVYLFDARIGMAIPGPGGRGVATLQDAATDPSVLASLDLPGASTYRTSRADLARSKLRVAVDSTLGYLSPRMRELQQNLAGRQRMVLFRDPSEIAEGFEKALGPYYGAADLWSMPMEVEVMLFTNPQFVQATQYAITLFDSKLPLLEARLMQLRGSLKEAVEKYVGMRFAENPQAKTGQPIPREIQDAIDKYATFFLGLAKVELGDAKNADFFLVQSLKMLPEPVLGQPFTYYNMYRWGAQSNLARLHEAGGNGALAIRYYCEPKPTWQMHGDLLHARDLIWRAPFVPGPTPSPQGPPSDGQAPSIAGGLLNVRP